MSQDPEETLALLRDNHTFPGPYTFKAIGTNDAAFVAAVAQTAVVVLGAAAQPDVSARQSKQGKHQAVSMKLHIERAEQVLAVYALLAKVPGVHMVL